MKKLVFIIFGILFSNYCCEAQSQFVSNNVSGSNSEYTIQNIKSLNSKHLDYYAIPYQNGIVFTSTRGNGGPFSCNNNFSGSNYSDLYYSEMDPDGKYQSPEPMRGDLNKKYHDGVVTFTPEGNRMYFSRNNDEGTNDAGTKHLKIYSSDLKKGTWTNFQEISFNNEDYATCHPALSQDGTTLYFASDRPGGYGGMDIYQSIKTGETWSTPVNLGAIINSTGNEIFPFVDENGKLFFASNGHPGNGGLDVFYATYNANKWTNPMALPTPVNSAFDDFGFTSAIGSQKGFFTSNRKGGKGKDDIYAWEYSGKPTIKANICVVDAADQSRINDAHLIIKSSTPVTNSENLSEALQLTSVIIDGEKYMVFKDDAVTTQNGGFQPNQSCEVVLSVQPNENFIISVDKPGYEPVQLTVNSADLTAQSDYLIPLKKVPLRKTITGTVVNNNDKKPLPYSFVKLKNKCTNETTEIRTDAQGVFSFALDCQCDYELMGTQTNFNDGSAKLSPSTFGCDNVPEKVEVPLRPKKVAPPVAKKEAYYKGKIIQLDKLFYDYDKANIRSDAAIELNKVVKLLKDYPSMIIELGSHTDSRGSDTYNRDLSQRRADSAIQYIISQGVKANRVSARGYGETQLTNRCRNGVECSKEEHQANRRTEIKVVQFEEENVKIVD